MRSCPSYFFHTSLNKTSCPLASFASQDRRQDVLTPRGKVLHRLYTGDHYHPISVRGKYRNSPDTISRLLSFVSGSTPVPDFALALTQHNLLNRQVCPSRRRKAIHRHAPW